MNRNAGTAFLLKGLIVSIIVQLFLPDTSISQQLKITDFVIFGNTGSVQMGPSTYVNGGSIGSYKYVNSTGLINVTSNIYSGGTISLSNSNTVGGKIGAKNSAN